MPTGTGDIPPPPTPQDYRRLKAVLRLAGLLCVVGAAFLVGGGMVAIARWEFGGYAAFLGFILGVIGFLAWFVMLSLPDTSSPYMLSYTHDYTDEYAQPGAIIPRTLPDDLPPPGES